MKKVVLIGAFMLVSSLSFAKGNVDSKVVVKANTTKMAKVKKVKADECCYTETIGGFTARACRPCCSDAYNAVQDMLCCQE